VTKGGNPHDVLVGCQTLKRRQIYLGRPLGGRRERGKRDEALLSPFLSEKKKGWGQAAAGSGRAGLLQLRKRFKVERGAFGGRSAVRRK